MISAQEKLFGLRPSGQTKLDHSSFKEGRLRHS